MISQSLGSTTVMTDVYSVTVPENITFYHFMVFILMFQVLELHVHVFSCD